MRLVGLSAVVLILGLVLTSCGGEGPSPGDSRTGSGGSSTTVTGAAEVTRESEATTADDQEEAVPEITGPDYRVAAVTPLAEANPDFYEGPIEQSGIPAASVDVIVDSEGAIQAAYGDATNTLTDYDIMTLSFWADRPGGEIYDQLFFFRTPEAQRAYQEEAMDNLEELNEGTAN